MCPICDGICETVKIEHPYQYYNIIEQIKKFMSEGILVLVEGNCDFNRIKRDNPFPDDVPYHLFECSNCKQRFSLCVETYHGYGGTWKVVNN